ncbi:MAG TPA: HlyD family efflux transporter periplasmic adaptor subunit [Oscillospiraceae bacterium]|nr:HlyD family efflux transporter periplasmic adaptor subunit [Oscillospiraceae bacterium]
MLKKKRAKIIIIASAAVIVAAGGIIGFTVFAKSGSSDSTTTFRTSQAKTGNIEITVTGSGTISDSNEYSLTATNAGTIDSLPVKQGDTIKAGQTIAHISDTNSAETILQKQNALASAKSTLTQSQQNLSSLTMKAPVAGKVKSVIASAGDDLSTLKSLGNLAVISTERSMTLSVNASQQSLKMGDTVTVTDTATGKAYSGTVSGSGQGGIAITIGTDDPKVGDTASVATASGTTVGNGTLALTKSVPISANGNSGTISNVYVSENQMVSKNAALFKLNSDSVESDIQMKQNAVTAAQKDLTDAQTAATKDTITSPIDGVIAELAVKNGASVTAGGSVATIINPNIMQTVVSVDELDISKVQVGQKATITLDAITGKTFSGSVVQVDPIGTSSNGVTTYSVTVSVDNPTGIKIGMNTNVAIITQSKENVVVLPASALLNKRGTTAYVLSADSLVDSNGKSIQLKNANTAELIQKYGKQITIGLSNADNVEVTNGLSDGDKIAVAVTISKSAIASLNNSQSTTNGYSGFGGMGGGMGGYGGTGTRANRNRTGTGNTVSGSTNGTTGTTGTGKTGNTAGNGTTGKNGNNAGGGTDGANNFGGTGGTGRTNNYGGTGGN